MKILVIGAGGQLGYDITRLAQDDTIPVKRHQLDITDFHKVREIMSLKPDVVINCAAYNLVDACEDDDKTAFLINAYAVRNLAIASENVLFVHISTDYVFDGEKGEPYVENDQTNPISVYGLSKLAGEIFTREHARKHIIVRSCGLYGIWGSEISGRSFRNFPERVMETLKTGKKMKVVKDRFASPTYTKDLARKILELVKEGFQGTVHIVNGDGISWYDFAVKVAQKSNLNSDDIVPILSSELKSKAKRPRFSVLKNAVLESIDKNDMMDTDSALEDYIRDRLG